MPKIRGIKPDFWTDEDIMDLSIPARLLFIGLWNYACDNGHLQDKPKQIKMRLLPGDDVNCTELLRELEDSGRILRAAGVITIPNFGRHQKPDRRYFTTCNLTDCPEPSETVSQRESRRAHTGRTTSAHRAHDVGTTSALGDGDCDGEVKGSDGDSESATTPRKKPSTTLPNDWKPTSQHQERAILADLSLGAEVEKFKLHAETHDRRAVNWNAAFTTWLTKAAEFAERDRPTSRTTNLRPVQDIPQPPDGLTDAEYRAWWDKNRRAK